MRQVDNNINEKQPNGIKEELLNVNNEELPDGYDVIDTYQNITEQAIVDNLFDYLGKVYYETNHSSKGEKIRNTAISKYDKQLFKFINRKLGMFIAWAVFFIAITIAGALSFSILVGSTPVKIVDQINIFAIDWNWTLVYVEALIYSIFSLLCLFALISLFCLIMILYWFITRCSQRTRVKEKITQWKSNYARFTCNLSKSGIKNAMQASDPELILDKTTPVYDKRIYNLHSRISSYSDIPADAKKTEYKNLSSGFYKGYAFSLSYSSWEWFRDTKVINKIPSKSKQDSMVGASRSLKKLTDDICVLTIDTFAEPKLNFVLNNVEGANIRLQNNVFNKLFSLAVNNPQLAFKVFTPYVQHTLSRCKTWSQSSKSIRQVIKEGSEIHVIFDGKKDFFDFEMLTNPEKNVAFIAKEKYLKKTTSADSKARNSIAYLKNKYGSLDDTASLMVEYMLNETDILYTALEMGTCFPTSNTFKHHSKKIEKTLFDVLEEKRKSISFNSSIPQLNEELDEMLQAETNFNSKQPTFTPLKNFDPNSSNNNI